MTTELIRGLYNIKPQHRGCVVTIGNFDGVHIGHQALLEKVKKRAKEMSAHSLVLTFEPLPKEFFGRDKLVPRLTRWREKYYAFSQCKVNQVLLLHFNQALAALSAEDFVKEILYKKLAVKHIIIGDDFRFGKARQGDFEFLRAAGQQYGFTVEDMQSVLLGDVRVSSTSVREALALADHSLAEKLLGRPYTMQGCVVHGHQRGRIIGFPTANIYLHRALSAVEGVYAVRMHGKGINGLPGVANVGRRPTVGGTRSLLEVHLFDFNREIYGQHVHVEFCKKLRDERRFENLDLLKEQIFKDAAEAREFFLL